MTDREIVRLNPNGKGAQVYLGSKLLDDSLCVLRQGQECHAHVIDGVGILITATGDTREFDISTSEPDRPTVGGDD